MRKPEFFKLCDLAQDRDVYPLTVQWGVEARGSERVVNLCGSFPGISHKELYRPFPGRQYKDVGGYLMAEDSCEKAATKFRKWLAQYEERK